MISQIKISFNGLISRLDTTKEIISKPKKTLPIFLMPKPILFPLQIPASEFYKFSFQIVISVFYVTPSSLLASHDIYMQMKSKLLFLPKTSPSSRLDNSIWMSNRYLSTNMAKTEFLISLYSHQSLNLLFSILFNSTSILFNCII